MVGSRGTSTSPSKESSAPRRRAEATTAAPRTSAAKPSTGRSGSRRTSLPFSSLASLLLSFHLSMANERASRPMLILSYLAFLGFIPLLFAREDPEVRWHARNGLLLFAEVAAIALVATFMGAL